MSLPDEVAARASAATLRARLEDARAGKRTLVMGVLNVTPDSFSDGGLHFDPRAAEEAAAEMAAAGADILDVGGESTRPATFRAGQGLPADEELRRTVPAIEAIAGRLPSVPISIDTYKAGVARAAISAGAVMINDVSALRADPEMAAVTAELGIPICLMHMPGLPGALPLHPEYGDVVMEVMAYLAEQTRAAVEAGIAPERIVIDPGFGFGKTALQNLEIVRRLTEFRTLPFPLLIGTSRKSTIGEVLGGLPPAERLEGTAATVAIGIAYGAAIVRVHDVKEMVRVVKISDAIVHGWEGGA